MIGDERLSVFLSSLDAGLSTDLEDYARWAAGEGVPIIRRDVASLLRTICALARPMKILEVGTGVGFSGLLFCAYAPKGMQLVTVESQASRAAKAREAFCRFGREGQVKVLEGDASRILPLLEPSFDLVFMDAAKGQYLFWLPEVLRLMHTGSILISDNVLQEGEIVQSRFLVQRRDRTIHQRMREYLRELNENPLLATSVLPVGDGLALSVKVEV